MLQQIPGSKVIYVDIGTTTVYALCHNPNMGYHIAVSVKPEDVVFCAPRQAQSIMNMLNQMSTILMVNNFGNEEHRTMYGTKGVICDVGFTPECAAPEPPKETPKETPKCTYRLVNNDGNYLRFTASRGYYIDPDGPYSHIVKFFDETGANALMRDLLDTEFKNLKGGMVDSDLSVAVREF